MVNKSPVLMILVDALGHEMINNHHMPYLEEFIKGSDGPYELTPLLGYSDAQRMAFFTGETPKDSLYWTDSVMVKEGSILEPLSKLGFLDNMPNDFIKRCFKFFLSLTICKLMALKSSYDALPIYNLPFKAMPYFAPSLKKNMLDQTPFENTSTLFDLIRESNRKFHTIQTDRYGLKNIMKLPTELLPRMINDIHNTPRNTDFIYMYIHCVDMWGHRHGIKSDKFVQVLESTDSALEQIIQVANSHFGENLRVCIVSDHGMNHTTEFVDFSPLVKNTGFGRDYVVALDSTMVRIWYFNEKGKTSIRNFFSDDTLGHFLTKNEIIDYGIDFPDNRYFEDIYLLKEGKSIFPNFHSYLKPMAMHAYDPHSYDQQGILILNGFDDTFKNHTNNRTDIKEVMPFLQKSLNLMPSKKLN
jgi:predicted AlkP superfamily pyrophosphatase or phosphodiesterase